MLQLCESRLDRGAIRALFGMSASGIPERDEPPHSQRRSNALARFHGRVPVIKLLPLSAVVAIAALAVVNVLVWACVGAVLVSSALRRRQRGA